MAAMVAVSSSDGRVGMVSVGGEGARMKDLSSKHSSAETIVVLHSG